MKTAKGIIRALILLACFVVFFFFRGEASRSFSYLHDLALSVFDPGYSYAALREERLKNASLAEELRGLKNPAPFRVSATVLSARVYSRYPFSDKNRIAIDKGFEDGITEGMPVLAEQGVLLGRVSAVRRVQSEVETIADPAWKTSVAVGEARVRAVLEGGVPPRIGLIPKEAAIREGDPVTNIDPDFPMGLLIGTARAAGDDAKKVWLAADVELPYRIDDLQSVFVMTHFR